MTRVVEFYEIRVIAAEAKCAPETVEKVLAGNPKARRSSVERVRDALKKHGMLDLMPLTTAKGERK